MPGLTLVTELDLPRSYETICNTPKNTMKKDISNASIGSYFEETQKIGSTFLSQMHIAEECFIEQNDHVTEKHRIKKSQEMTNCLASRASSVDDNNYSSPNRTATKLSPVFFLRPRFYLGFLLCFRQCVFSPSSHGQPFRYTLSNQSERYAKQFSQRLSFFFQL